MQLIGKVFALKFVWKSGPGEHAMPRVGVTLGDDLIFVDWRRRIFGSLMGLWLAHVGYRIGTEIVTV